MGIVNYLMGVLNGFYKYNHTGIAGMVYAAGSLSFTFFLLKVIDIRKMEIEQYSPYLALIYISGALTNVIYLLIAAIITLPFIIKMLIPYFNVVEIKNSLIRTLWCTLPILLSSNSYFWISLLSLSAFGIGKEYLGMFNIAIGYAATVFLVAFFSLPSVPEIGSAYEKKNYVLIRELVRCVVKSDMFLAGLILSTYVSMSYPLLYIFHTEVYTKAQIAFIFAIIATTIISLEYANIMILVGLKRERFGGISALVTILVSLTILSLILFAGVRIFGLDENIGNITLPSVVLIFIASLITIFLFSEIKKSVKYLPSSSIVKSILASAIATVFGFYLYPLIYPNVDIIQLALSALIPAIIYIILLLILGYFDE